MTDVNRRAKYVDPMTPDPREEKLPVWAAAAIERLRNRVTAAERDAAKARLSNGPADTDTLMDPYADVPIRLPKSESIRFILGATPEGRVQREYVDARVARDSLGGPSYLYVSGGDGLIVHPQASNVVRISVGD